MGGGGGVSQGFSPGEQVDGGNTNLLTVCQLVCVTYILFLTMTQAEKGCVTSFSGMSAICVGRN